MQIGEAVDAVVEEVAPYGLFVRANGMSGLILLPELSWQRVCDPAEVARAGDQIQCKIMHFPPRHQSTDEPRFIGSIRELNPEQNPWRDPSVFAVGTEFTGTVERKMTYGIFFAHPRGVSALLHIDSYDSDALEFNIGDEIDVVVIDCDAEGQRISVGLSTT